MIILLSAILFILLTLPFTSVAAEGDLERIKPVASISDTGWQKTMAFPDAWGYVDDTLAMNSMVSFHGFHNQGYVYLSVSGDVESFSLYVNGHRIKTDSLSGGTYCIDCADLMLDGRNTVQITNIRPSNLNAAVTVYIPYPVIMPGSLSESGIRPETIQLISDLIESDIDYGFTSAQLAIVRNGRLVYENAWGTLNAYNPDGTRKLDSHEVTTDTLYDLASITKVMAVNLALQKLVTEGKLDINTPVIDLLGSGFSEDTIEIHYENYTFPGLETMKAWKATLTVRDLLCHHAGFPADLHYHSQQFDMEKLSEMPGGKNILFAGNDGSETTRENTLKAIFKTPLMVQPRTKTLYSDIDYILLGFIVESITGQRLDEYMRSNFFEPMHLTHITYNPLQNGFTSDDCAATELNGNTRDHLIHFPVIREYTLQGEVHDEKAWYGMGGVSGHAGLFARASDLATLASVMLTGGYGENQFFSRTVMDMFAAPKSANQGQWGLGWWRNGDDQRPWYFGTQTDSDTIGHQGWTGTLLMIDPSRQLVIAYLTNKINSPITSSKKTNSFTGNFYTASTLGFVPQLLSIGLDEDRDVTQQLIDLLADMANESAKLMKSEHADDPSVLNVKSKLAVLRAWAKDQPEYLSIADEIEQQLP